MLAKSIEKNSSIVFTITIGVILLTISSYLVIPWVPVPLTLQTNAIFILSALFGNLGIYSVMAYLVAGTLGLPVFAEASGGAHILFGATGGYFLGFILASIISNFCWESQKHAVNVAMGIFLGTLVVFFTGWLQLSIFCGYKVAFELGVQPFLLSEFIKMLLSFIMIYSYFKCQYSTN